MRRRKPKPKPDWDAIAVRRALWKSNPRTQRRALDRAFNNAVARAQRVAGPEREPRAVLDADTLTVRDAALAEALGISAADVAAD